MVRDFFHTLLFTMIAAAPDGRPRGGLVTKNFPARRASKKALRRGSIEYITIFMVRE